MTDLLATLSRTRRRLVLAALAAFAGVMPVHVPTAAAAGADQPGDRISYVLMAEGSERSMMSASTDDLRRLRGLRVGRQALLYIRQGGAAYVIRDAGTLRRAAAILEPQRAMGARQAELGSRQAALGRRQAALGAEQARLGARQADASPRLAASLGRQQGELGARQNLLGREQNELGRQQSALGQEQNRLAREAEAGLSALLAEAIRSGAAQRVD